MNQSDQKPSLDQKQKNNMLEELESLSQMLEQDNWEEDVEDPRPVPEDIPVLKSFVEGVPTLNTPSEPNSESEERTSTSEHDTQDSASGTYNTVPVGDTGKLDMSFLDQDPLQISNTVRQHSRQQAARQTPSPSRFSSASATPQANVTPSRPAAQSSHTHATGMDSANRISHQLKQAVGSENPFLSKATLEKIRENRAWTPDKSNASEELHKLLKDNPLQKMSFDATATSKEYQALRSKASQLINDIIRASLPRLEAELRMKLEQEVDLMFKDAQKKSRK